MKLVEVELSLPEEIWRWLDHMAEQQGVTIDEVVCDAVREFCHRRGIVLDSGPREPAGG